MPRRCTRRFGRALLLFCSGILAAALAHVAIDILGDSLLPHDTYDGTGHLSRSVLAALVVVAGGIGALRAVGGALHGRIAARAIVPASTLRFVLATIVLAAMLLVAMEWLDASLAGQQLDDVGDLFGGSLALGTVTLVACAAGVAIAATQLLRALIGATAAIVRAVRALLITSARPARLQADDRLANLRVLRPVFARRASKRGPPLLSSLGS